MKIIVMITICEKNKDRIANQITALQKNTSKDIVPVFVYGADDITTNIPHNNIQLKEVEERYTNLYKKIILGLEYINSHFDYDYILKIDDDTLVNYNLLKEVQWNQDYVGRSHNNFSKNVIDIDLPMFNIKKNINLYPPQFNEPFSFMTGDFYALSKKAVNYVLEKKEYLKEFKENSYVCEDQLIGYILKDKDITTLDINFMSKEIEENVLQVTQNLISLHPVNFHLFDHLLSLPPTDQLNKLLEAKRINLWYRKSLLKKLEEDLSNLLLEFANSKKAMGLG